MSLPIMVIKINFEAQGNLLFDCISFFDKIAVMRSLIL